MTKEKNTNLKQGFTLLELLVVVLIIGILAGIAIPQYQMAVGRAKFATIKDKTKAVVEAAQRYYMIHGTYVGAKDNLDIDFTNLGCAIIDGTITPYVQCYTFIFGKYVHFYVNRDTGVPLTCYVNSTDKSHKANLLCQKETGDNTPSCSGSYCGYDY